MENITIEGIANVKLPANVFYNNVQEFNRDLTISVIKTFIFISHDACSNAESECKGIKILEALAASGLRSIRFALEIPHISEITANDYDSNAVELMKENILCNGMQHLVTASQSDASLLMYNNRSKKLFYDVIDLDPYGSASVFLDSAVQSVCEGGLLCVTCTDMAVLCGNVPETCHSKYASVSLKSKFCHEMAVRILLRTIELHANKYSRYIQPLLSLSVDFYCRVFVRLHTGQDEVRASATKLSTVFLCNQCSAFHLQPLCRSEPARKGKVKYTATVNTTIPLTCDQCNGRFIVGGPIWSHPIHDPNFVSRVISHVEGNEKLFATQARIVGVLSVVAEELIDAPLYYDVPHLCTVVHCTAPSFLAIRSAILNGGYRVSLSHANKSSLKTDAPMNFIWDIIRCWVKRNPVKEGRLAENTTANKILSKETTSPIDFTLHPLANPPSRQKGLLRWQINPLKDWGPGCRATRNKKSPIQPAHKKVKLNSEELKKFKCKKFLKNNCQLGDSCLYSHNQIDEDGVFSHNQIDEDCVLSHNQIDEDGVLNHNHNDEDDVLSLNQNDNNILSHQNDDDILTNTNGNTSKNINENILDADESDVIMKNNLSDSFTCNL